MTFDPNSDGNETAFSKLIARLSANKSVLIACIITIALFLWVISGVVFDPKETTKAPAIAERTGSSDVFQVETMTVLRQPHVRVIELQGRTEADRQVTLSAETVGTIIARPAMKGQRVKKGDTICQIDAGARKAQLDEAKALQAARRIDFDAAKQLFEKGHTSKTQVAAAKANYDASAALRKIRQVELDRTFIKAPFSGIIDRLPLEVGDLMPLGGVCAKLIDKSPLLVIAFVGENEVSELNVGATATIILATGETASGVVRYVAESPTGYTRTFQIEIEIPNKDEALRDGVSVRAKIAAANVPATKISQGIMTLNDAGEIGVKVVRDNRAQFIPVNIISDSADEAWVTGLNDTEELIIAGQDFVRDGEIVRTQGGLNKPGKTLDKFSAN